MNDERNSLGPWSLRLAVAATWMAAALLTGSSSVGAAQATVAKSVGTVKSVSGKTIALTPESGGETTVIVQDGARVVRVEPGSTDLNNAAPLDLEDLQPGDRILVRGSAGADGKSVLAVSVIAMKKADLAEKHARERAEWQRNGVGGLVTALEAASGTLQVDTSAMGTSKNVTVTTTKATILRRYAPGSVSFDEAVAAPLDQIKVGDQLRARGTRSADGRSLQADEIVSGSFRNIAGTIASIDGNNKSITVNDLTTKKPVMVKLGATSQLKKLPQPMAQRLATRLKGNLGEASGPEQTGAASASSSNSSSAPPSVSASPSPSNRDGAGRRGEQAGSGSGARQGAGGAGGDFQQALSRMPAASLTDLQKGDAVMIVATSDVQGRGVTAITLLAGVEPILQASPNSGQSILTPWSLSGAPGGDAAAQ